jgi:hypothetical protein
VTVPLTGTGGHFTRVGKEGKALNDINTFRGNSGTIGTDWLAIFGQFASTDQIVIDRLWTQLTALQNNLSAGANYLRSLVQATTIQMVQDDTHIDGQTLFPNLEELIRQMNVSHDKVKQPTVSVTVTSGNGVLTNHGDGVCIATILDQTRTQTDYAFPETLVASCSKDSQSVTGAASLGKEPFTVTGEVAVDPITDPTWPVGSGASITVSAVTADDSAVQATNLIANGSFETQTTPPAFDFWQAVLPGTTTWGAGTPYRGANSLKITADGSSNPSITQGLAGLNGGSTAKLAPLTVYAINFWAKVDSGMLAGVTEIALTDGNGTILTDASGANLSFSLTMSGLTTSFVAKNAFFRTPAALPTSGVQLRIKQTTPATNAKAIYIDDVVLRPAVQLYNGGPFAAIFSGATEFIVGDQFNVAVANDYNTGGSAWQLFAERAYGMRDLGLILPSTSASGSITILDSLLS